MNDEYYFNIIINFDEEEMYFLDIAENKLEHKLFKKSKYNTEIEK